MVSWSTTTVHARERFAYWREVVCQTVLSVSTEAPRDRFYARIAGRTFGALRVASFESSGHEIVRSSQHVALASEPNYLVSLQLHGQSHISQGDERICLEPNEIAVVDGHMPFRVGFPGPVSRILAVIPREMLMRRAPWMKEMPPCRKIDSTSPYWTLARQHLLHLATETPAAMRESETILLADNLCNLLALASARDFQAGRLEPEPMLEAVLAFCRQHLHNTELSPLFVASHFGISVRTLHLRFQQFGQSFGRWLLESRLEACSNALRDPIQQRSTVSNIAYRWGFSDLSHFNKAFRARYGMPPGQWRLSSAPPGL